MAVGLDSGGSTSEFRNMREGVVLKYPRRIWKESSAYASLTKQIAHRFSDEHGILDHLGEHPRVVWCVRLVSVRESGEHHRAVTLADISGGTNLPRGPPSQRQATVTSILFRA